jgi:hypothetical protein
MKYNREDESRWTKPFLECEKTGNFIQKSFTSQCFSYLPIHDKSLLEIEILIRKHRIDDLTKRLIL